MILARTWPVAIAVVDLSINQDVKALRSRNGILAEYLAYILRTLERKILLKVETAAHGTKRLKTGTLKGFSIPLVPLPEQHRIVAYLDGVQARVTELKRLQAQSVAELERLEGAILARAFRGEL